MDTPSSPPLPSGAASSSGGQPSALLNQPIVIDNGTHNLRAGYAGGPSPRHIIPSIIGHSKHIRVMPGGALEDSPTEALEGSSSIGSTVGGTAGTGSSSRGRYKVYVGKRVAEHRGAMIIRRLMRRGVVEDGSWKDMERLWEHVFSRENLHTPASEHPLLLTETPFSPSSHRTRATETLFETFRTPALHYAMPGILSLYASGRTTGVVLDVGDGSAHAVPVYEGHALPHSVVRTDVGGCDVTEMVRTVLRRSRGYHLGTSAEMELAREIKENVCFASSTPLTSGGWERGFGVLDDDAALTTSPYLLPDGNALELSERDRSSPSEILFNPSLAGSEELSVSSALLASIKRADVDLRCSLLENVVLAGGTTLTPGFGERVLADLRAGGPDHARIRIGAPPERINSAWIGGSILASLSTFKNMWVTRAEWEEAGSSVWGRRGL